MARKLSVLFVCMGNICRSPLAEAAFRAATARHGLDVHIDSAGTGNWHVGDPPDRRARAVARQNGIDIDHYRARVVTERDFHEFSHVIALDHANLEHLKRLRPEDATAELALLLDHVAQREGQAVVDPYYGTAHDFTVTWRDVSEGAEALALHLKQKAR
ncbi:low molecular weight protein-tyrosine-phosphatase [Novacetimonas pomaceti]|uniref:protein-tyrosine-phosphatase n=1 Tax=Novacetimonas pomaceti TaxID=2021998 RepID=A0A318QU04_9PROT|nr:low molecular weight protein-tyrosine-phosphatase [Novacetimonas pomaceti]PYD76183.1 phosphotyrosine protein phosphatase [Novacetimonas pomaceti]